MVDWIDEEDMIDRMIIDEKLFLYQQSHTRGQRLREDISNYCKLDKFLNSLEFI